MLFSFFCVLAFSGSVFGGVLLQRDGRDAEFPNLERRGLSPKSKHNWQIFHRNQRPIPKLKMAEKDQPLIIDQMRFSPGDGVQMYGWNNDVGNLAALALYDNALWITNIARSIGMKKNLWIHKVSDSYLDDNVWDGRSHSPLYKEEGSELVVWTPTPRLDTVEADTFMKTTNYTWRNQKEEPTQGRLLFNLVTTTHKVKGMQMQECTELMAKNFFTYSDVSIAQYMKEQRDKAKQENEECKEENPHANPNPIVVSTELQTMKKEYKYLWLLKRLVRRNRKEYFLYYGGELLTHVVFGDQETPKVRWYRWANFKYMEGYKPPPEAFASHIAEEFISEEEVLGDTQG